MVRSIRRQELTGSTVSEDPIIIVLGESGVGKSNFISVARGTSLRNGPKIGHGLNPCTTNVKEFLVKNQHSPEQRARLVDTPGFDADEAETYDASLNKIVAWLKEELKPNTRIAGIITLTAMDLQRLNKNMEASSKKIPTPPGVVIATTKWDAQTAPMDKKLERELELEAKFTTVRRFENTPESAWNIITEIQQSSCSMTQEEFLTALQGRKGWITSIVDKMGIWFRYMFA